MNLAIMLSLASFLTLHSCGQDAPPAQQEGLGGMVQKALEGTKLPGAVMALVKVGEPTRIGAAGVRKRGKKAAFTADDLVHIGSDTKAMTAVMLGRLVDREILTWDLTVGEAFKKDAKKIHEDFRAVTLAQLMRHTAGLPENADDWQAYRGGKVEKRRRKIALDALAEKPLSKPGTKNHYSNLSVMVAGCMAESVTGDTWEELMEEEVFGPLGMDSAGFGSPGKKGKLDQPWGHVELEGETYPVQADNDPAMGPAGTVHLSMEDWGKFVQVFFKGSEHSTGDTPYLLPATLKEIQTPGKNDYSMGWIVVERPWAGGTALSHAGSNTMWFANAWVVPEKGVAFLLATNTAVDGTPKILDGLLEELIGLWQSESKAGK